jgi:hypothetical protein
MKLQHLVLLGGIVAILAIAALLRLSDINLARAQTPLLSAIPVDTDPGVDPTAGVWDDAPTVDIPLTAQNIVYPNGGGTIPLVSAQAVHFDGSLSIRLAWTDDSPDQSSVAVEDFSDAVAVMFPAQAASAVPAITMGQADAGVNIWYWRADSQIGVPLNPDSVYDGTLVDYYPFADEDIFYPARAVGNPTAGDAIEPVQNLIAQGFGTLSPAIEQTTAGSGVYADGSWQVVITRSLSSGDPDQATFAVGSTSDIAFAVWDGDNGDRNGQKSISQFLRLSVLGPDDPTPAPDAPASIERDDDGTELAPLLGFAVGAPIVLLLILGWMYMVYGRKRI